MTINGIFPLNQTNEFPGASNIKEGDKAELVSVLHNEKDYLIPVVTGSQNSDFYLVEKGPVLPLSMRDLPGSEKDTIIREAFAAVDAKDYSSTTFVRLIANAQYVSDETIASTKGDAIPLKQQDAKISEQSTFVLEEPKEKPGFHLPRIENKGAAAKDAGIAMGGGFLTFLGIKGMGSEGFLGKALGFVATVIGVGVEVLNLDITQNKLKDQAEKIADKNDADRNIVDFVTKVLHQIAEKMR